MEINITCFFEESELVSLKETLLGILDNALEELKEQPLSEEEIDEDTQIFIEICEEVKSANSIEDLFYQATYMFSSSMYSGSYGVFHVAIHSFFDWIAYEKNIIFDFKNNIFIKK